MSNFKTAMMACAMAAALTGSQAMAADVHLPAGKPAGVSQAQNGSPNLLLLAGAATIAVVAVVVATTASDSASCGSACVAPTTVVPSTST